MIEYKMNFTLNYKDAKIRVKCMQCEFYLNVSHESKTFLISATRPKADADQTFASRIDFILR